VEHSGAPAYVISEVEVRDPALAARYRELAAASIEAYGGRYVVRGAQPDALEGEWPPARRLVIVEFASREQAERWYRSEEYAQALALRDALDRRLIIADGLPG
jgi:uncharacterized protein (DUF1330 family)